MDVKETKPKTKEKVPLPKGPLWQGHKFLNATQMVAATKNLHVQMDKYMLMDVSVYECELYKLRIC